MNLVFVGAGRMGRPMVERLRAAGHDVRVHRRSDSLSRLSDADVVFSVVHSDAQVRELWLAAPLKPSTTLVQHTTCSPATLEEIAARGISVLDAALSGGPHDVAAGTLTLWVGGDVQRLEAVRPLLSTYASPLSHVGRVGDGQRIKLVNNALFVAQLGLAVEAVRVGAGLGITESTLLAALSQGSAARSLEVIARAGVLGLAARLAVLMRKDVDVVREVAQRAGADLGLLEAVLASDPVQRQILGREPEP